MPNQRVVHQTFYFPNVGDSIRVRCSPSAVEILYRGTVRKLPNKTVETWGDAELEAGLDIPLLVAADYMADLLVVFVQPTVKGSASVEIEHRRNGTVLKSDTFGPDVINAASGSIHLVTLDAFVS